MVSLSSFRLRAALIVIVLKSGCLGLVPNTSAGATKQSGLLISSATAEFENKRHKVTYLSASIAAGDTAAPPNGRLSKKQLKAAEEFQWLNWVYKQWKPKKAGDLSDKILKQMVPAISRWARRRSFESAERSEELLERIVEESIAGNPHAELTVTLFNSAMDGFAKIGNPAGVQRILRRMETLRAKYDHLDHLKPDVFSMSTLATAWAKSRSPEAASKAEDILNYMDVKNLTPNTITYNAVLHALAMGNQIDKALRAEDVVKRMEKQAAEGGDCKPDIYSYQSLIQAWAKTSLPGSPQKAEQILRFLDKESEKGNGDLSPNGYCFTTTIHAWAKSSEKGRARSANEILQHMRKRYTEKYSKQIKPNVVAFTAVLNACSRPMDESEREEAFQIAHLAMAELTLGTYDKPNFLSYAAFLSVCASTLDEGDARDEIVHSSFKECAMAGQMGQIVIDKLRNAASPTLYEDLIGQYITQDGSLCLPRKWTKSIKGERPAESHSPSRETRTTVPVSESSKLRLKAVQKFGGKTGIYSSGGAPQRLEAEGISWSMRPLKS